MLLLDSRKRRGDMTSGRRSTGELYRPVSIGIRGLEAVVEMSISGELARNSRNVDMVVVGLGVVVVGVVVVAIAEIIMRY